MMECTDRHDRFLLRLISRRTLLYTEMVPVGAVVHGDAERFLRFSRAEHPVAVQFGGSDPAQLAEAAAAAAGYGYDEINLNVGCPSARVRAGRFGACLMREPRLVAACVRAMASAVSIPVTVKCRIGVDEQDEYAHLEDFARTVVDAGCNALLVHARKAWLNGISPKANRTLPPLRHDRVYRLKQAMPDVPIVLNGGVQSLADAQRHLGRVDGVMIGREAYGNPFLLAGADRLVFGESAPAPTRRSVVRDYARYLQAELATGTPLARMVRHLHGLYQGLPGARQWRRALSPAALGGCTDVAAFLESALADVEAVAAGHRESRHRADATTPAVAAMVHL
jgi:tRNA-dihydrouridine synthase A